MVGEINILCRREEISRAWELDNMTVANDIMLVWGFLSTDVCGKVHTELYSLHYVHCAWRFLLKILNIFVLES